MWERNNNPLAAFPMPLTHPQPRHGPWVGIELATPPHTGGRPANPARVRSCSYRQCAALMRPGERGGDVTEMEGFLHSAVLCGLLWLLPPGYLSRCCLSVSIQRTSHQQIFHKPKLINLGYFLNISKSWAVSATFHLRRGYTSKCIQLKNVNFIRRLFEPRTFQSQTVALPGDPAPGASLRPSPALVGQAIQHLPMKHFKFQELHLSSTTFTEKLDVSSKIWTKCKQNVRTHSQSNSKPL